jgi:hypothetical protein
MFDDGLNGDGLAGDHVFGAKPCPADKSVVEFYVQASDTQGRTTYPTATGVWLWDQNVYRVDDLEATLVPSRSTVLSCDPTGGPWLNLMDNISGGQFSDAQMNGALVGSIALERCPGIASASATAAPTRGPRGHNLHLSIPLTILAGISRLDFNTRFVHSQVAGNAILSSASLLNAYGAPVRVRVNANNLANATRTAVLTFQFRICYAFSREVNGPAHIPGFTAEPRKGFYSTQPH